MELPPCCWRKRKAGAPGSSSRVNGAIGDYGGGVVPRSGSTENSFTDSGIDAAVEPPSAKSRSWTSGRSVFGKKSKRWKPLLQASQKASERSGRLETMEAEKIRLEATLKGLEAKLATSQARLQTLTDEQTRLSEDCRYFEQGAQALESDLELLEQRW